MISTEGTTSIRIHEAYLLLEAVGSEIASLPMGGNDINPVSILHVLKEFIIKVKRELCLPDSLWQMPVVALVKVLAMRLGHEERWCLAHFRTLSVREPY